MYDVVIIGSGPAGYNGALQCAKLGLKTALVEAKDIGGTCLNCGCIPTKCLLKSAEVFHAAKKASDFGVVAENIDIDMEKIYARKEAIVKKLGSGVEFLIKKAEIDYIKGYASFLDANNINIAKADGENIVVQAKNIIIASGSSPATLNLAGIEHTKNSDDILKSGTDGQNIVIIGGGVIGCEFASFYAFLGRKVTIIEAESRILPQMDRDISNYLSMSLKKLGVSIVVNAKVNAINKIDSSLSVIVDTAKGSNSIDCDEVIVSVGRKANIANLKLDNAGVAYQRTITTDENFATNVPYIYAVGDVTSKIQLAHLAEAQAINVAYTIANKKPPMDLSVVPSCVYTNPEIAMVGQCEVLDGYKVVKLPIGSNGKAVIEDSIVGMVKTIFNQEDIIVGAVIMCSRATDMIAELALAISAKLTRSQIQATIHAHPTLSETVRQTAED